MKILICVFFLLPLCTHAKLIDKTVAIVNDNVITLSPIKRIKSNLKARRSISPMIYNKDSFSTQEIVKKRIRTTLIRNKLSEMGYVISDDQVEGEVGSMEKRLGLNREALLNFLKGNNFSFDEYFELIRESIEYNLFVSRVIRPLVSITDQDIKNEYYKNNSRNKTLNFKYTLVDFSLSKSSFKKGMLSNFQGVMKRFQQNGVLPSQYKKVETSVIKDISEDGLTKNLKRLLKKTNEGSFTKPILISGRYHLFFIKVKDLAESSGYLEVKNRIRNQLFAKSVNSVSSTWFDSESSKYYIKMYL
jgi:peptidyl-prolyl cis-trans isomerase SurA